MRSLWPRGNGNGGNMAVHFPNQSRSYDPTRRFFSWIYRIAVNECLNARRARKPVEELSELEADPRESPLQGVEALERSESMT